MVDADVDGWTEVRETILVSVIETDNHKEKQVCPINPFNSNHN